LPGLPREKVVAAVVRLLELTSVRVGNEAYARLNRSFGLSTLRVRHARVRGGAIRLRFRGKGGRSVEVGVIDRRLAAVVRRCQDLPGQALFEYLDVAGRVEPIDSADVNLYIREALGDDRFSAKDLRTWAGTLAAFRALRDAAAAESATTEPARVRAIPAGRGAGAASRVTQAQGGRLGVRPKRKAGEGIVSESLATPIEAGVIQWTPTFSDLLRLMEELLETMDLRDSSDPDAPTWEASLRIRQLETELADRLGARPSTSDMRAFVRTAELATA
jgi:hypothetical protein